MFKKGTRMIFIHNNQPAYEKLNDEVDGLWVCLFGMYLVKEQHTDPKTGEMYWVDVSYPESDLPLYRKDGSLNRTGFKWTDEMVLKYFKDIMIFELDGFL
jgi:hypothetical protein